jgi:FixJ family two-component response regulator
VRGRTLVLEDVVGPVTPPLEALLERLAGDGEEVPGRIALRSRGREETTTAIAPRAPLIAVVDDDESVRESLPDLLRTFGFASRAFSSATEFLASDVVDQTGCLILDVAMPGMTGPALQQELVRRGSAIPIVFITAHESLRSRVLEAGAIDSLLKPFSEAALLDAVTRALRKP